MPALPTFPAARFWKISHLQPPLYLALVDIGEDGYDHPSIVFGAAKFALDRPFAVRFDNFDRFVTGYPDLGQIVPISIPVKNELPSACGL